MKILISGKYLQKIKFSFDLKFRIVDQNKEKILRNIISIYLFYRIHWFELRILRLSIVLRK